MYSADGMLTTFFIYILQHYQMFGHTLRSLYWFTTVHLIRHSLTMVVITEHVFPDT